ncbi:WSC domain containing protein [Metarhizium guizhouense ARSEF 977]|uniref:WSC domain containing protein n=1 Tax=Metarhizium guizhouense (strain ARSEF 977) TaxID=1276136 RepID=A0A0B4HKA3_METGA|nr:WSC domain containing protein [Metarhizium guizhouense ARSEF 977]
MRYVLLALGAGNLAMAMFTNTTDGQETAGKAVSNTLPPVVGDYELLGCSAANDDFKSFVQVASTDHMDLDFCSASCHSKFMAVSGKDCFCGEKADAAQKLDAGMCNSPCPGNQAQSCGGNGGGNTRRDGAAPMKAVSMYVRSQAAEAGGAITKTITTTKVATVTKCPSTVTNCPVGKPTYVVTKVTEACPRPTEAIEWHKKKITCYGGYCAPEIPRQSEKQRVICDGAKCHAESCYNKDWSSLVLCKGDDCKWSTSDDDRWFEKKIVCFDSKCAWENCHGDECHKKFVCRGDECKHESCSGDDCHKKFICDHKGDNCKLAPPCNGKDCPKPPPPCHDKCRKPQPPPPCHGDNCRAVPCQGNDCVKPVRPTGTSRGTGTGTGRNTGTGRSTGTGTIYPHPIPTGPPIVAGAGNVVANVIGAAAGLLLVL